MEEVAVKVDPGEKLWESVTKAKTRIHWWSAVIIKGEVLRANPQEVAHIFWMTQRQLLEHEDLLPGNRDFLNRD